MTTKTISYDACIAIISALPIVSGTGYTLVDAFKIDILSKVDITHCNLELLYCAYYFYNKAIDLGIVRGSSTEYDTILSCKRWLHEYFDSDIVLPSEQSLLSYLGRNYNKGDSPIRNMIVLDIVRYMSISMYPSKVKHDDTTYAHEAAVAPAPDIYELAANEHLNVGAAELYYDSDADVHNDDIDSICLSDDL